MYASIPLPQRMASHGGMVGLIAACWIFAARRKLPILHVIDLAAFACPPGLFLGRIANFVNAELWGRALPAEQQAPAPWWSVKYPEEILLHPDLEALTPAVEIVEKGTSEWNTALANAAVDVEAEAVVGSIVHNVVDAARAGNEAVADAIAPLLTAYYPSQLIQAVVEGPLLMGILALVWLKPRKPGVVGSVFLIAYGALRIATEVVRQPDEGVALVMGLSRGQLLSLLMFLTGLVCLVIATRRKADPVGGLRRGA